MLGLEVKTCHLTISLHRWRNWGSEKWNELSNFTQEGQSSFQCTFYIITYILQMRKPKLEVVNKLSKVWLRFKLNTSDSNVVHYSAKAFLLAFIYILRNFKHPLKRIWPIDPDGCVKSQKRGNGRSNKLNVSEKWSGKEGRYYQMILETL